MARRSAHDRILESERESTEDELFEIGIEGSAPWRGWTSFRVCQIAALTDAGLPEQVLAQFRKGGVFVKGPLAPLDEDEALLEEMLIPVSDILDAVTHAAMLPAQQLEALLAALEPLANVVVAASRGVDRDAWD